MTRTRLLLALTVTAAFLFACAPDPGPFFTPGDTPENPPAFREGHLGLLTPVLRKPNELIAFRILSGLTMPAEPAVPSVDAQVPWGMGVQVWMQARKQISDPAAPEYINTYRNNSQGNSYLYYPNCLDDAFVTAAQTLEDRQKSYHSTELVRDWVIAQDQVFANCGGNQSSYPAPARRGALLLAQFDRDYQVAAAYFYSENFDEAIERFRAIAKEPASPWRYVAAYLVGRAFLREASLHNKAEARNEARDQFERVANDPAAGSFIDPARKMVAHIDAIEHANATLALLSKRLLTPQPPAGSLADSIQQSTFVLTASSFQSALSKPELPEAFDWVETLEKGGEEQVREHAIARWEEKKTLPWLIVSLIHADGKDGMSPELIAAAERLPESSPGFETANYNAIRLRLERGETDTLRAPLDRLLSQTKEQGSSVINGFRAERMRAANNFDDFLQWAPRIPVDIDRASGDQVLAYDSAYVLNYLTPLAKLREAAHSSRLPAWSATDVAFAGWTRAFMLGDMDAVKDFGAIAGKARPDWAASLVPAAGEQVEVWRFRAALLVALHAQFEPMVKVNYRPQLQSGSWWCAVSAPAQANETTNQSEIPGEANWIAWKLPVMFKPLAGVLSQEERETARREIQFLHDKGTTQAFVAPIIFGWAKHHPDDPLVPQALHRLVVVTRYGCSYNDASSGGISKAAFDLLHTKYPNSRWTAETPYWFK